MATEIEAKFKIDNLDTFAKRLRELGAQPRPTVLQRDTFLDRPDGFLLNKDAGLRIRQTDNQTILCTKGPRQPGPYKKRTEIELPAPSFDQALEMFQILGYSPCLCLEKKRTEYTLNDCLICLDQVALLGSFIEIEGPDEPAIKAIIDRLSLTSIPTITDSYAAMVAQYLKGKTPPLEALFPKS